jgi:hypothetical protein
MLTRKQTEAYLAWAIHGRKPQRRAQSSIRKGPPRDEDYKQWIRTLACIACGVQGRSEAAHTGSDGGISMKASDYSCVPLCTDCHTQAPGAYHRIGKRAFEQLHRISFAEVVSQLNQEWPGKCA